MQSKFTQVSMARKNCIQFIYILTLAHIRHAGCWKNRNSVLGRNQLYSLLIIK